jgi:hypothetical protein
MSVPCQCMPNRFNSWRMQVKAVFSFFLICYFLAAGNAAGESDRRSSGERHAGTAAAKRHIGQDGYAGRQVRLLTLVNSFVHTSMVSSEQEMKVLEAEIDRIPLLDFPNRQVDINSLLDWYRDYTGWLKEESTILDEGVSDISSGNYPSASWWDKAVGSLVRIQEKFLRRLEKMVGSYEAEGKRLAEILDRRTQLADSVSIISGKLDRLGSEREGLRRKGAETGQVRRKEEKLRREISIVQSELLSLPKIDESLLKHYFVIAERGKGEGDLLGFRIALSASLHDLTAVAAGKDRASASELAASLRQVIRECVRQIERMGLRIDDADRKRSMVTPSGTLREIQRSEELGAYYLDLRQRYEDAVKNVNQLRGGLEYELTFSGQIK